MTTALRLEAADIHDIDRRADVHNLGPAAGTRRERLYVDDLRISVGGLDHCLFVPKFSDLIRANIANKLLLFLYEIRFAWM